MTNVRPFARLATSSSTELLLIDMEGFAGLKPSMSIRSCHEENCHMSSNYRSYSKSLDPTVLAHEGSRSNLGDRA